MGKRSWFSKLLSVCLVILFSFSPAGSGSRAQGDQQLAPGTTERVSLASDGTQANDYSFYPSISGDGRYVSFTSMADNLIGRTTNHSQQVYAHDLHTGITEQVSVASNGTQGNSGSYFASISGDGRFVAFDSGATNFVPGHPPRENDVFVHDRETGITERDSVASDGTQGDWNSAYPDISGDGRFVAFWSYASNLVGGDTDGFADIFVHDRQAGLTERVSVDREGNQGNGDFVRASISDDGNRVAFESSATNLVVGDTNGFTDCFVHDRSTNQTIRVSVANDGTQGNDKCGTPFMSGNGRFVGFESNASNLVKFDTNEHLDIFIHDIQTGITELVSVGSGWEQSNGDAWTYTNSPVSNDGRFVVFASGADNLVSGDNNNNCYNVHVNCTDVFIRDRLTHQTRRVSLASDGSQGNGASEIPAISGDGRFVAFESGANNLVPNDTNGQGDIFVHYLGEIPPTYTVSGKVTLVDPPGEPLAGVRVFAGGMNAVTDAGGIYTITNVISGTYSIFPLLRNYAFTPISNTVTVSGTIGGVDFSGSASPMPVMGFLPMMRRR